MRFLRAQRAYEKVLTGIFTPGSSLTTLALTLIQSAEGLGALKGTVPSWQ